MYLEFYGLQELPFNITPDPRFLCNIGHHGEALDHLLYGIEHRKGFITLTGEVGSGKTTLCRAALSRLPETIHTALVLNPCLDDLQLLRAILNDFGLPAGTHDDRLRHLETLNAFLLEQAEIGHNVALFIDEAQNLSPEVMEQVRLLSNLETDRHKLMQIVLVGQPELRERLATPELRQLRQRILVRCHLSALEEEETRAYIAHRLKVAGAQEYPTFDSSAVKRVHRYAKGIPRLVNAVCDCALMAGYIKERRIITSVEVRRAVVQLEEGL